MNGMIFNTSRKRNSSQKNTNTVYSEYSYSGIVLKERALRVLFLMFPIFTAFSGDLTNMQTTNFTVKVYSMRMSLIRTRTICPWNRDAYGLRWRCNKRSCAVPPKKMAAHKSKSKGDRGIDDSDETVTIDANDNDYDDDDDVGGGGGGSGGGDGGDLEIKDNKGTFSVCERESKPRGDVSLTRGKGKDGYFLVCPQM